MDGEHEPPGDDYEVGYCKPPQVHRFKKGQSGNPSGRPRRQEKKALQPSDSADRPTKQALLSEAYRMVSIREGDQIIQLPAIQAVFRSLGVAGMKGNRIAAKLFAELTQKIEEEDRNERFELFKTTVEYKQHWEPKFRLAEELGRPPPDVLPHPDDIVFDVRSGTSEILGPMTPEEKWRYDMVIELRDVCQKKVSDLTETMRLLPRKRKQLKKSILDAQRLFDLLNNLLVGRYRSSLVGRIVED